MGQNQTTRIWTAGFSPCFHLPGIHFGYSRINPWSKLSPFTRNILVPTYQTTISLTTFQKYGCLVNGNQDIPGKWDHHSHLLPNLRWSFPIGSPKPRSERSKPRARSRQAQKEKVAAIEAQGREIEAPKRVGHGCAPVQAHHFVGTVLPGVSMNLEQKWLVMT